MKENNPFDDIARKVFNLLPDEVSQIQGDIESNIKTVIQSGLAKMNLVTREEFDIQSALLKRTREKLDRLEKQLAGLTDENK